MMLSALICLLEFVFGCQSMDSQSANPAVSSGPGFASTYASNEMVDGSPGDGEMPLLVDTLSFDNVLIVYDAGVDDGVLFIDYAYDNLGIVGPKQQMLIGLDGSSFGLLDEDGGTVFGYSCNLEGSTEIAHIQLDTVAISMSQDTSQTGALRIGVESGGFRDEVTFASEDALDSAVALYERVQSHPTQVNSLTERELQLLAQVERLHSWAPRFELLFGDKAFATNLDRLIYSDNLRAWLSEQPEFGNAESLPGTIKSACKWIRILKAIVRGFGANDSTGGTIVETLHLICGALQQTGVFRQ